MALSRSTADGGQHAASSRVSRDNSETISGNDMKGSISVDDSRNNDMTSLKQDDEMRSPIARSNGHTASNRNNSYDSYSLFSYYTFEILMLLVIWWIIAGLIIIEYKFINQTDYAFWCTGVTNFFAGIYLLTATIIIRYRKKAPSYIFLSELTYVEGAMLVIIGTINGLEYGLLNKALMELPIAQRQMMGSASTLFLMLFAKLWRLPPNMTKKFFLCGFLLLCGGMLQAVPVLHTLHGSGIPSGGKSSNEGVHGIHGNTIPTSGIEPVIGVRPEIGIDGKSTAKSSSGLIQPGKPELGIVSNGSKPGAKTRGPIIGIHEHLPKKGTKKNGSTSTVSRTASSDSKGSETSDSKDVRRASRVSFFMKDHSLSQTSSGSGLNHATFLDGGRRLNVVHKEISNSMPGYKRATLAPIHLKGQTLFEGHSVAEKDDRELDVQSKSNDGTNADGTTTADPLAEAPHAFTFVGLWIQFIAMLVSSNKNCALQYMLQVTPGISKLDKISMGSRTMLYSGASSLVFSYFLEGSAMYYAPASHILVLKLLGIASILCIMVTAELRILQLTSTVTFGIFGLLHTIPIVLSGVILFGDMVTWWEWSGFTVCLGGSYWYMQLARADHEARKNFERLSDREMPNAMDSDHHQTGQKNTAPIGDASDTTTLKLKSPKSPKLSINLKDIPVD